jgi:hypothetical protein
MTTDLKHRQKEFAEYQQFLKEQAANRKRTIENECTNERHTWNHYYGGYVRCSTCGEELP